MRYLILATGLILLSILQSNLTVNLILVFVAVVSLYSRLNDGLFIAFIGGVIADYVSGLPDGVFVINYLLLVLGIRFFAKLFSEKKENVLALVAIMVGTTLVYYIGVYVLSELFISISNSPKFNIGELFKKRLWIEVVLNLIAFYPVYLYYFYINKLAVRYEK